MENEKTNEMSYENLADLLIENPEMIDQIIGEVDNLNELYSTVFKRSVDTTIPQNQTADNAIHNQKVQKILSALTNYEYSDTRSSNKRNDLTPERKEELQEELDDYISLGYPPDKLDDYCTKRGYDIKEIYNTDSLKERYADYGITYDPEEGSLNAPWFSETRYFTPSLQKNSKTDKLSALEAELSNLEGESKILSEAEKQMEMGSQDRGDR